MWLQANVFCEFYWENCLIISVLKIAFDLRLKMKLKTYFQYPMFYKGFHYSFFSDGK